MKWTLLLLAFDRLCYSSDKKFAYTVRPDNGRWDIVGYQNADLPERITTGHHGCDGDVRFGQFRIYYKDHDKKLPDYLTREESEVLLAIAKCEPAPKGLCERLADYGYVIRTENGYEPDILVLGSSELTPFDEMEKTAIQNAVKEIRALLTEAKSYAASVTAKDLPVTFREDERMCHFACVNNYISRSYVLEQALTDGWLKYDENTSKTIGVYLYI